MLVCSFACTGAKKMDFNLRSSEAFYTSSVDLMDNAFPEFGGLLCQIPWHTGRRGHLWLVVHLRSGVTWTYQWRVTPLPLRDWWLLAIQPGWEELGFWERLQLQCVRCRHGYHTHHERIHELYHLETFWALPQCSWLMVLIFFKISSCWAEFPDDVLYPYWAKSHKFQFSYMHVCKMSLCHNYIVMVYMYLASLLVTFSVYWSGWVLD